MASRKTFTGRVRRQSRRSVRLADHLARALISACGIGTIAAVLLVCLFLVWVAWPLFSKSSVARVGGHPVDGKAVQPLQIGMSEHQTLGWALLPDSTLEVFRADDGRRLERRKLFDTPAMTAASFAVDSRGDMAVGFDDGTIRVGRIGFGSRHLPVGDVPPHARQLRLGQVAVHRGGVINRTPQGDFRWQWVEASFAAPIKGPTDSPVRLIDHVVRTKETAYCALWEDGTLRVSEAREQKNFLTGQATFRTTSGELPLKVDANPPDYLLLSGLGDNVMAAWNDGRLVRFDTRNISQPKLAERLNLIEGPRVRLTSLGFLLGRKTLIAGDSSGRLRVWFRTKPEGAETVDRAVLVSVRDLPAGGAAVTALGSSSRSRVIAAGFADGRTRVYQVTAGSLLADLPAARDEPVSQVVMSPKEDGLWVATPTSVSHWRAQLKHPEASFATFFRPVWYEGYQGPTHVWQSSGGTDDQEPKLGLISLIFGTLKATFYSILFGAPLALLAALYTSEFLHPRVKARIKPAIELMASLPSVVLGFLAALVIAPVVDQAVPEILTAFVTVPLTILLGGYLWQFAPQRVGLLLASWRLVLILLALAAGVATAWQAGPAVEQWLFAGNIKAWLDGQVGTGTGAWLILFLPLSAAITFLIGREADSWLRHKSADWGRTRLALADLLKFVAGVALAIGGALAASLLLTSLRFDPRGTFVDTYDQRNSLVVGFVMGFAIIPIIYTIAEDALSSVPDHLRSASLGAGATPWQTATRIVIPAAMSGLFSALMIGLGRAVGETMIVLMAAGNVPVMKMNIFEGFRTLAANIAVEMPEAVKDSTHYRTLFLSAVALFAMTFLVNTTAELVRLRFRRRLYEL